MRSLRDAPHAPSELVPTGTSSPRGDVRLRRTCPWLSQFGPTGRKKRPEQRNSCQHREGLPRFRPDVFNTRTPMRPDSGASMTFYRAGEALSRDTTAGRIIETRAGDGNGSPSPLPTGRDRPRRERGYRNPRQSRVGTGQTQPGAVGLLKHPRSPSGRRWVWRPAAPFTTRTLATSCQCHKAGSRRL